MKTEAEILELINTCILPKFPNARANDEKSLEFKRGVLFAFGYVLEMSQEEIEKLMNS